VHKLADAFDISRPAISRHLRVLKQAGLVAEVKKGRENLYALQREKLAKGSIWIAAMAEAARAPAPEVKKAPTPKITVPPAVMEPVPRANQMGFDF
jgi:DNA-binding transcriptional ArsR family regulator